MASPRPLRAPRAPITSLEAKIVQYHYVDCKLRRFQKQLGALDATELPDLKPVMLLAGTLFNMSDHFFRRSELVQRGDRFNIAQTIHLTGALAPLSFDSLEALDDTKSGIGSNWSTKHAFCELPTEKKASETLKMLHSLVANARSVLNEKINMAREMYSENNKSLFEYLDTNHALEFDEFDLIPKMGHKNVPVNCDPKNQDRIKSYFRHCYFSMLKEMCIYFQNKVDCLRMDHARLTMQAPTQEGYYQIYFNLLRIADLYVEIRKVGRWVYFDNATYFTLFARGNRNLKMTVGEMSVVFGGNKQNTIVLSTISKYAKRTLTPVNTQNLRQQMDQIAQQYIIESRRSGKQMCETMVTAIGTLKSLTDEWDTILAEGREHVFSQEKIREQMRQRVLDSRSRQSMAMDPAMVAKAANMRAAAAGASGASAARQPLIRPPSRVSSQPPSSVPSRPTSRAGSRPGSRPGSRAGSLTASSEMTRKLIQAKEMELQSTDERRRMSITAGTQSPFLKPSSAPQSRSNSLTKKPGDLSRLFAKPQLSADVITPEASPLKSPSPSETGLTRTSSVRSPTLQRRHSVVSPLRPQVANSDTIRRRQSAYQPQGSTSVSTSTSTSSSTSASTSITSLSDSRPKPLTAQQRLQQHIMKSQKNGSMLAKPLEPKPKATARVKASASASSAKPSEVNTGAEPSAKPVAVMTKSPVLDTVDLGIELGAPSPILSSSNFPGALPNVVVSPLNSLKRNARHEAQAALAAVQRSRTNSNAVRSRTGSTTSNVGRSRTGSTNQLSRQSSVRSRSNSRAVRSRTDSAASLGGNTIVVPPTDLTVDENGNTVKRVRFTGVAQYSEDEDAHTADRMRKQMRQKWAAYKPLFRKLNSQEGETLRQFKEEERQHARPLAASQITGSALFEALHSTPNERGKVSLMGAIGEQSSPSGAKRISRLFGRR